METTAMEPETLDPFALAIHEIDRLQIDSASHLSVQMDADCLAAARAAMDSGQTASVTISVVFKRKGDVLEVSGTCKSKLPKRAAGSVRLYADEEGRLHQHNPFTAAALLPGVDARTPQRRTAGEVPTNAKKA